MMAFVAYKKRERERTERENQRIHTELPVFLYTEKLLFQI